MYMSMDERPTLSELEERIDIVDWHSLGIQLELNPRKLEEIDYSRVRVNDARRRMFQLWLDTSPSPTRRELIKKLQSRAVGKRSLAREYEKYAETVSCGDGGPNAGSQPQLLTADNNKRCNGKILWIIAPMLIIVLSFVPVLYELQEIKKLLLVVSVTPLTTDLKLKEVLYDSGSYLKVNKFGKDYAVRLHYLAPDYGRVILDLYNSDTGDVVQHSNVRYSGCGLYRESNVLVLNSLLDGEWGKVERPRGFPFLPSQETSFIVTATENAFMILSQSGGFTFKYYYQYRSKAEPENIDRIDSYVLEYRDCPPVKKGKVLQFDLGKQINEFRLGTIITVCGTAPPNVGQTLGISVIKGPTEMKEDSLSTILRIDLESGIDVPAGVKFTVSIMASQYSIQVLVNGRPHQSHEVKVGISNVPHVVSVWVIGVYELDEIDSVYKAVDVQ